MIPLSIRLACGAENAIGSNRGNSITVSVHRECGGEVPGRANDTIGVTAIAKLRRGAGVAVACAGNAVASVIRARRCREETSWAIRAS